MYLNYNWYKENGEVKLDDNTVEIFDIVRGSTIAPFISPDALGGDDEWILGQPNGQAVSFTIHAIDKAAPPGFDVCVTPIDVLNPYKYEGELGK